MSARDLAKRRQAIALLRKGAEPEVVADTVGARLETVARWQAQIAEVAPQSQIRFRVRGLPVRLRIARSAAVVQLELRRGPELLAVLGVVRAGVWDLSLAGDAHRGALERVLPAVVARARSPRLEASA